MLEGDLLSVIFGCGLFVLSVLIFDKMLDVIISKVKKLIKNRGE